mmetsp:Transcript_14860/g.59554  ORF Transcript_14860/g.59554 Transcript_14860/m.59554 type:complete len:233 (+) Transcript_14860:2768-3466(+)
MMAASRSAYLSHLSAKSSKSTFPAASDFTVTTLSPAMTAEAGFVPCAETGMRQTSRCSPPVARWYSRIANKPAYSPEAPELGWTETAWKPVILARSAQSESIISRYPSTWSAGAKGCMLHVSGHVTGIISAVALSFIVHEPSEIIEWFSERSLPSSDRRYRSICVSDRCAENTWWGKKLSVRASATGAVEASSVASSTATFGNAPSTATTSAVVSVSPNESPTVESSTTRTL